MVGFYYGGHWLLRIFNCDIHSFATAGGFLMFLMALEMILDVEIFKNNTPNKGATMVPMVFPLIAGAGVLTTLISLKAMYDDVNIFIGLAINMLWVFLVIKSTGKIQKWLGEGGMMFSRKFFGIILLAMSVKMMTENIAHLF
jgi:multiple antibiotic resistance protein